MKEITVNTTVGKLIPEGNYCESLDGEMLCQFVHNWVGNPTGQQWVCGIKGDKPLKSALEEGYAFHKLDSCPKPPSEVKKNG